LGSIRYSEDIDFDVQTVGRETLRKNVNAILESKSFHTILRSQRLAIADWSAPKQTDTVQRWKVRIQLVGSEQAAPTKIEFSRRRIDPGVLLEPVNGQLVAAYGLSPILANHYGKETAFLQKVSALAHRSETQARDVFDLKLLVDAAAKLPAADEKLAMEFSLAIERALSISFDEFKAQVVAYLPPEWQEYYGRPEAWDKLQEQVVQALGEEAA
jgi:predicted nucleotidyltransferase component of viral defense system